MAWLESPSAMRAGTACSRSVGRSSPRAGGVPGSSRAGAGGAEAVSGGGLDGLRRRMAVFDGTLDIASPSGGPTRVRLAVPCESL